MLASSYQVSLPNCCRRLSVQETVSVRLIFHRPASRYIGSENIAVKEPGHEKILQVYLYIRIVILQLEGYSIT
jgi:hypothetical protein